MTARDAAGVAISEQAYRAHVERLASDEFEGRGPGSEGERLTVQYLEQEFLALGLQPVNGGSFRQPVPLVEITALGSQSYLDFFAGDRRIALAYGEDMTVSTRIAQPASWVDESQLVFAGYGIVAPEYGWDDYAGVDMRGKTAMILLNDPGFASDDPALFKGRAMTYYGRWTYKLEEAARQGAAAAIIIHETRAAAYPWEVVRNGRTGPQFHVDASDGTKRLAIEAWVTHERAGEVLSLGGQDLALLESSAARRGFSAVPLGLTVSAGVRNAIRHSVSSNVAAILPGKDRPDEYVVYMAHWDHLGRAPVLTGDSIFNGAQDNATGVAGILSIARGFQAMLSAPARSVMFIAFTAEESGLVGSEFYARNPLAPLEKTVAAINIDSLYPLGRARDLQVIGSGASDLEDRLAAAAAAQDRILIPDQNPEAGFFYRSDQVSLARRGVPVLYVRSGLDLIDKPAGTGQAMVAEYFASRYHRQTDDYEPTWDVSGSIEDLRLLYEVGASLAADTAWASWYPGNEFSAVRDASAAARAAAP
jgi:Zn-dependent M28 family amino/carboxypeptidase